MFKACGRCGKIHDINKVCQVGKKFSGGEERDLRHTRKWQNKSKEIRESAQWLCEVCRDQGTINYRHLEVHHITSVRDDKSLLLDNENLVVLCSRHHKQADNGEIDADYLRALAVNRERKDTPRG